MLAQLFFCLKLQGRAASVAFPLAWMLCLCLGHQALSWQRSLPSNVWPERRVALC